jgi:hypothetical protein
MSQVLMAKTNKDNIFSNIIIESAVFAQPEKVKKYTDGKVIFEAYLQEADTKNQNKRIYPQKVLNEAMNKINEKIARRAFVGELDHPISEDQVRQTTVMYKEVSHIIREWGWDGTLIRGVVETTPYSPNGKTLSGLILDRVPVGFSLRGLADVEDKSSFQEVLSPLIIISYDSVSEPSHNTATIQEIRNEHVVHIMNESKQLIRCSNGKCYLPNYFDELIEKRILKLSSRYKYL